MSWLSSNSWLTAAVSTYRRPVIWSFGITLAICAIA